MISRRRACLSVVGAVALLALHGSAAVAQSTPMRFIVGLAPGGAVDPYARIIAEHMAKTLCRHIIVENRPGPAATSRPKSWPMPRRMAR